MASYRKLDCDEDSYLFQPVQESSRFIVIKTQQ